MKPISLSAETKSRKGHEMYVIQSSEGSKAYAFRNGANLFNLVDFDRGPSVRVGKLIEASGQLGVTIDNPRASFQPLTAFKLGEPIRAESLFAVGLAFFGAFPFQSMEDKEEALREAFASYTAAFVRIAHLLKNPIGLKILAEEDKLTPTGFMELMATGKKKLVLAALKTSVSPATVDLSESLLKDEEVFEALLQFLKRQKDAPIQGLFQKLMENGEKEKALELLPLVKTRRAAKKTFSCLVKHNEFDKGLEIAEKFDLLPSEGLKAAVESRRVENLQKLLEEGADPQIHDVLLEAVELDEKEMVKLLLEAGARPNTEALSKAATRDDFETVEMLLEHGASPRETLHQCFFSLSEGMLERLLDSSHLTKDFTKVFVLRLYLDREEIWKSEESFKKIVVFAKKAGIEVFKNPELKDRLYKALMVSRVRRRARL